ncbi:MAG: hypothetical protein FWD27_08480, partial [Coriobacteriia bacterium]|nr:hypothetical protein [Coriobacteriia bacterium]
ASNAFFTVEEAAAFLEGATDADYIKAAGARVVTLFEDIPKGSPTLVGSMPAFAAVPGIYKLTFAVDQDPSVRVTVNFVVMQGDEIAGNKRYSIAASNAFFTVDEAEAFLAGATDADYIKAAGAQVLTLLADIPFGSPKLTNSIPSFAAVPGTYRITFAVDQDPTVSVTVNFVVMQGDEIAGNKRYAIAASHVFMTADEARAFISAGLTPARLVAAANVDVRTLMQGIPTGVAAVASAPALAPRTGVYPATFAVSQDPSLRVTVNFVVMQGDVVEGGSRYAIAANYVYLTTTEAQDFLRTVNEAAYVARAGAHAIKHDSPGTATAMWTSGSVRSQVDTYPVTFAVAEDPSVSVTVKFVVMQGDAIAGNTKYAIAASHVYMTTSEAASFLASGANYVRAANAHAIVVDATGKATAQRSSGGIFANEGVYLVSFEVAEDPRVSTTVMFVIMDGNVIDGNSSYALSANHVVMTEVQAIAWLASSPDYVVRANARAINLESSSFGIPTVAKIAGTMLAAPGVYPITFGILADSSLRVTVNFEVTAGPNLTLSYYSNGHSSGSAPVATTHLEGSSVAVEARGSLTRPGYTFAGWAINNPNGTTQGDVTHRPGASISMSGHMSLYAVWVEDPVAPVVETPQPIIIQPPAPAPIVQVPPPVIIQQPAPVIQMPQPLVIQQPAPAPIIVNPPAVYAPAAPIVQLPAPAPETVFVEKPATPPVSTPTAITTDPMPQPVIAMEPEASWSLINLISSILLMFILLAGLIRFVRRPHAHEDEDALNRSYRSGSNLEHESTAEQGKHSLPSRIFMAFSAATALVALILFVLTQDLSVSMVLLDVYSSVFIVLLVAELICTIALFVSAHVSSVNKEKGTDEYPVTVGKSATLTMLD